MDEVFPTRIDSYKRISENTLDTIKKVYMAYTSLGQPLMMVDQNGYLTEFNYDGTYRRIRSITLPGDFTYIPPYDSTIFIHDTIYDYTVTIPSSGWGKVTPSSGNELFVGMNAQKINDCQIFEMNENSLYPSSSYYPFIKFNYMELKNFVSIDTAFLRIDPASYTLDINNIRMDTSDFSANFKYVYQTTSLIPTSCGSNSGMPSKKWTKN
ncbi:MAG: hypothetical protein K8I03_13185 [Ignavibacteria bacterium]|nr:hypothetical protein [Ignavibacteria bacterium]